MNLINKFLVKTIYAADTEINIIGRGGAEEVQDLSIGSFISAAIGAAFGIAGILVFAMLIWGGISWVTSGGDKEKTESARNRITNALVGLAIIAASWAIIKLLEAFLGINILSTVIPSVQGQ